MTFILQLFLPKRIFYQGRPNKMISAAGNPTPAFMLLNMPAVGRDQQFGAFNISEVVVNALGLKYTPGVLQYALGPVQPMVDVLYNYSTVWNNISAIDSIADSCEYDPVGACLFLALSMFYARIHQHVLCAVGDPFCNAG
mgnify:CR=1 FL=1